MDSVHKFASYHVDEDCSDLTGTHDNELFFNCTFDKLSGLTLKNCDLGRSEFVTTSVVDALNFTLTLNCNSFRDVTLSPLLFDLLLALLVTSAGNSEKREKLLDVIGKDRAKVLLRVLKDIE
jgi:hypothetical protein